jgi:hypothetical protein
MYRFAAGRRSCFNARIAADALVATMPKCQVAIAVFVSVGLGGAALAVLDAYEL